MKRFLLSFGLLPLLAGLACGQVSVQQSASHLDTGVTCQVIGTPAVNTQNTLTFVVPSGQALYLTSIKLAVEADGTGGTALSLGRFTTTNLQSLEWDVSFVGTANTYQDVIAMSNPAGIVKSAIGPLSVTIVSPAGGAHNAYPMMACGYFAP